MQYLYNCINQFTSNHHQHSDSIIRQSVSYDDHSVKLSLSLLRSEKNYNCEANNLDVVWYGVAIMNRQIIYVLTDAY